jgi:hypothetical protein
VPVSATERRPPPPPFTFKVAALAPLLVGLNVTFTVQLAFPASEVPQLWVKPNCPGFVPTRAIPVIGTAVLPVFVTVTGRAALVVFVAWFPKASDWGETVSADVDVARSWT